MNRRRDLDGVRAVAIIGVLGIHSAQIPGGDFGVVVFFVLSGYLITTLLLRERDRTGRIDARHFYLRRAARLFPGLAVALAGYLALVPILGSGWAAGFRAVAAAAFYSTDIVIAFVTHRSNQVGWAWSLSIEEQFYAIWPLILGVALWRKRVGVAAEIAAIGVAVPITLRAVSGPHTSFLLLAPNGDRWLTRVYYAPDTRMDALFAGCLLALALWRWPKLADRRAGFIVGLGGLALIGWCYAKGDVFTRSTYTTLMPLCDLGSFALLYGLIATPSGPLSALLGFRPVAYIGRISYGIYIWNSTLGLLAGHIVRHGHHYEREAIWLAMVFAVSITSFHLIEQPILSRVGRRPQPRAVNPAASVAACLR
jgi:peptidoglycan/LPS O-acetylase OafA/YrhL